jgi:hypothetical protein
MTALSESSPAIAASCPPPAGIDLSQQHPLTQPLRTDPKLRAERLGHRPRRAILIQSFQSHTRRALALLSRVPVEHDLHPSQEKEAASNPGRFKVRCAEQELTVLRHSRPNR